MPIETRFAAADEGWFIYYRIRPEALADVASAVRAWQSLCQSQQRGLQASLMHRPEPGENGLTVMEIYLLYPSIPHAERPALRASIETALAPSLAPHLLGARHAEVFVPCA